MSHSQDLYIDPGTRLAGAGWAVFEHSTSKVEYAKQISVSSDYKGSRLWNLTAQKFRKSITHHADGSLRFLSVTIEWPEIYEHSSVDPDSILSLASVCGAIMQVVEGVESEQIIRPREWTKGRPKKANLLRTYQRCTDSEREIIWGADHVQIPSKIKSNDVRDYEDKTDAVAIGLFDHGRL